jgi:hypothetical protein
MSEQLDTDLVFSDIITDAILSEITANDVVTEIVADTSTIDLEALYANLELLSTVITPELVSSMSTNELIASETINESTADLANKNIIGNKASLAENAAMLIGEFKYFPEEAKTAETLIKILQYNREFFNKISLPESISLQPTINTIDEFFKYDNVSLMPIPHKEDFVVISELVTERLIKTLIKLFDDEIHTAEFFDSYSGNSRNRHDGKRSSDAISMQPLLTYADSRSSVDSCLRVMYKGVHDAIHAFDKFTTIGGDAESSTKLNDSRQSRDTLQIFLHDYFAENYVSFDYVAIDYTMKDKNVN